MSGRRRLLSAGTEPDPRFTLANERTFLAWIRTALACIAAGVAVEAFAADVLVEGIRGVLAIGLIGVGVVVAVGSLVRWFRIETALRARRRLPLPVVGGILAVGMAGAGVVTALVIVLA